MEFIKTHIFITGKKLDQSEEFDIIGQQAGALVQYMACCTRAGQ